MIVFILAIAALVIACAYMMVQLALSDGGRAALEPELLVVDDLAPEELAPESSVTFDAEPAMEPRA